MPEVLSEPLSDLSNSPALTKPAEDLAALARQLNQGHREIEQNDCEIEQLRAKSLEQARQNGRLLLLIKRSCGHGKWLPWIKANLEFSPKTANTYMVVAENWEQIRSASNFRSLSIREAYRLARTKKEEREAEDEGGEAADSTEEHSADASSDQEQDREAEGGGQEDGTAGAEEGSRAEGEGAHGGDEDAEAQGGRNQQAADGAKTKGRAKKLKSLCDSLAGSINTLLVEGDGQEAGPDLQSSHFTALEEIARDKKVIDPKARQKVVEALKSLSERRLQWSTAIG